LMAAIAVALIAAQGVVAGPVQSLSACLKVTPGEPLGTAVYSSWTDSDKARLEISVAGAEPGNYCIFVNQIKLEGVTFVVDETGAGSLRLDTAWGDYVPPIVDGSKISLKNCDITDYTYVLCGKFK
jgi:hypothetical protein